MVFESTVEDWKKAKKRAKFMEEHLLKDKGNFDDIMGCLVPEPDLDRFIDVCGPSGIGLDGTELNWLWTYLKNGDQAFYMSVSEHNDIPDSLVASTGW